MVELANPLIDEYQRQKEMERLRWNHEAQEQARQAVAAIVRSLGGKVVVPRMAQIETGELYRSQDPRTGDITYEVRDR